ncbi:MAG: transposase [Lachnospiraceae bacterium]
MKEPKKVEVVTMDMWSGYRSAVYETLPKAMVIIDKFHVVK